MILVTLGTNDKKFTRLLDAVEQSIHEGAITGKEVVQAGFTEYESSDMEVIAYIDQQKFAEYMNQADLIITHGGVGTIMTALREKKKILAAARLAKYHEHVNDHQTQLLESFEQAGYLIYMRDLTDIRPYLKQAETFEPKPYVSQRDHMVSLIENWIDQDQHAGH